MLCFKFSDEDIITREISKMQVNVMSSSQLKLGTGACPDHPPGTDSTMNAMCLRMEQNHSRCALLQVDLCPDNHLLSLDALVARKSRTRGCL